MSTHRLNFVLITFMCMTFILPFSSRADELSVYFLAGQSNMRGMGRAADVIGKVPEEIPHVFMLNSQGKMNPLSLKKNKKGRLPGFGPELGFGLEMATPERPVYIFKYAASGMPLHPGWNGNTWRGTDPLSAGKNFYPGTGPEDENKGSLYVTMMQKFKSALQTLEKQGHKPVVRGFVWMQGEQDAKNPESASVYAASLRQLHARVAEDLGMKPGDLPMTFGLVWPKAKAGSALAVIHEQMFSADKDSGKPEAIPNCKIVDTRGFSMRDAAHFNSEGLMKLGRAFAQNIRELNGDSPAPTK